MGGQSSTDLDDFTSSISSDPVLLMNPSVSPQAVVSPMTDLMTPAASEEMIQAYQQALTLYLNPEMSVIGPISAVNPSTVICAASDGFLSGWTYEQNNGDNALFTLVTDSNLNPTAVRGMGSMNQNSSSGIIVPSGNAIVPVRKGDYYNVLLDAAAGSPVFDSYFTAFNFPPTVSLGAWSTPTTYTTANTLTGTAQTDLFVCVTIQQQNDGDRGYVIGSINGTAIAAASMHSYTGNDIHIPQSSFLLPVPSGSSYSIAYTVTADNPLMTIYTIPLQSEIGSVLQAPVALSPNVTYTAPTDGFVVASLDATTSGSRGTLSGFAGQFPNLQTTVMVGNTSVHLYSNIDCYVPYNAITFPVTRGAQYNSAFNNSVDSTTCTVYWIGLSV
ncbi:hypothetical protein TSH100_05225 [Azospirillum sp. TSH100]|nr:hypothetical protein TSH100_05225 [Azospirillum sp. TSH100]